MKEKKTKVSQEEGKKEKNINGSKEGNKKGHAEKIQ